MGPRAGWLAAACALCVAVPAVAQDQRATEPEEGQTTIVVTGDAERPDGEEVYDQARDVSRVGRYQLYEEALPRFEAPVCPAVFGLRDDYAAAIVARIRDNITRLELPLQEAGCESNLLVAFMTDGRQFLADFESQRPEMFEWVPAAERDEILNQPSPVRVWTNTALRWTGNGPPPPNWPYDRPSVRGQLSRGLMPEVKDIMSAVVLFDQEAVVGMTLEQLADYATMRGLTNTRPASGDGPMATILAMFDDGTAELTPFDIGYLRSLYFSQANVSAANRFVHIPGQIENARAEEVAASEQAPPRPEVRGPPSTRERPPRRLIRK